MIYAPADRLSPARSAEGRYPLRPWREAALTAALLVCAAIGWTADAFPQIQYRTGKAGFTRKVDGTLIVDEKEIRFNDKKGGLMFRIAMGDVLRASQATAWREYPMTPGTREYVQVEARSGEVTETVVFRAPRHQSAALAAKIEFFREKAAAGPR